MSGLRSGGARRGATGAAAARAAALLLVGLAAPARLAAQEPTGGAPADASPDSADAVTLPGLVVRALRAPLSLGSLPFALSVREVGAEPTTPGLSLAEKLPAVPGLQIQSRYNEALGDRIVMRGFGARAQFGVRGVYLLVDGIPATLPDGQTTLNHLDLGLVDRAEILRGPAAAVHGNAAGGVLLLETRDPPQASFGQEFGAVSGGHGLLRLRSISGGRPGGGETAGAARDGIGWMASLARERQDGFRPHSDADRWQLTGKLELPFGGGRLDLAVHGVSYDAENPGSLTPAQFAEDPTQAQDFNVVQATGEEGRHAQAGATWTRPLGGSLRLETSVYGMVRSLENPIPPTIIELDRGAGGVRALLRGGAGDGTGVAWAAGVDAALQRDERRNFENLEGAAGELTLDQTERVTNVAAHGQALVPLAPGLRAFAGIRYDRVAFTADDRLVTPGNPDDSGDRAMDAASPGVGLLVDLDPTVALFANLATAFETPTTTELVNRPDGSGGFNEALDPQRTVSVELGARATPARGLRLDAAVYRARIEDALVPFEVEAAPGRQYFRNAGSAVHAGVELSAELRTDRLKVLASFALTDAEFDEHSTADAVFDGNEIPGVRPWTVGASVTARAGRLAVGMEYEGVGGMAVDDASLTRAPGHHLFGVRLSMDGPRVGGWRIEPFGGIENLLDRDHVASVVPNAFGGRYFEPGPGRTVYLGAAFGFSNERPGE